MMADIVIIEDDALMRSLLGEWLTEEGYRVLERAAADARPQPPADLIIVDVYMPRCRGGARLRAARDAYPATPILAISAQFSPGVACAGQAARALGVDAVVAKPFARADLLRSVRSLIGPAVHEAA
jgi:CheY-like chemotaxis protein